jgi:hypothetical protein
MSKNESCVVIFLLLKYLQFYYLFEFIGSNYLSLCCLKFIAALWNY